MLFTVVQDSIILMPLNGIFYLQDKVKNIVSPYAAEIDT